MPMRSDRIPKPSGSAISSRSSTPITLRSLPEIERATWRLVLHTLSVRCCTAFVREEEGRWMLVRARSALSPSEPEGGIHLSLRYLTPSEVQALPLIRDRMDEEGFSSFGAGSECLTVPLVTGNHMCGFLQASERRMSAPFSEHDRTTLQLLSRHVLSSLRSILRASEEDSPAYIDYLTHVYNYRYFCQRLKRDSLQAELSGRPLSLFMIDLNQYKRINDTHGHETGNLVLAQIASLLRRAVRETDVVCRYGGDEFVVILPDTDRQQALAVAHRLEAAVRACQVEIPGLGPVMIPHFSIGISTLPFSASSDEELIRQADQALYMAKRHSSPAIHSFDKASSLPAS